MDLWELAKGALAFVMVVAAFWALIVLGIRIGREYDRKAERGMPVLIAEFATTSAITGFVQMMLLAAILWRVW